MLAWWCSAATAPCPRDCRAGVCPCVWCPDLGAAEPGRGQVSGIWWAAQPPLPSTSLSSLQGALQPVPQVGGLHLGLRPQCPSLGGLEASGPPVHSVSVLCVRPKEVPWHGQGLLGLDLAGVWGTSKQSLQPRYGPCAPKWPLGTALWCPAGAGGKFTGVCLGTRWWLEGLKVGQN